MNLIIWLCLMQAVPFTFAVYHMPSRVVFTPPQALPKDSLFGYSITYYPKEYQVIVSAPTENNIGEVYKCDIAKPVCLKIKNGIQRISHNYTHQYWFGATVSAGPDFVVTCAPRYTDRSPSYSELGEFASCYRYSDGKFTILPSISEHDRIRNSPPLLEQTMDSFGWSIHVARDDSVIVGGPGMVTGRVMFYQPGKPGPEYMKYAKEYTPTYNFGYSVSSGTFINKGLSYAVGSTYGKIGFGEVSFSKKSQRQSQLQTDVVGSMFGAVLCAAKLSGSRSDLLVGAPTYAEKYSHNVGAVYLYISEKIGKSPKYKRTIKGRTDGSLFGSAIVSLGDLNGDNKDEIAISAPFENDGHGVVYVYSGADLISSKALNWMQKIEPETSYATSFGWSLTPLLDYDQNGCNEIAIGSPYVDKVVLYKCLAAITVKAYMKFPSLQNRTQSGKTKFEFQACLSVEYPLLPKVIIANIESTVMMIHPNAILIQTMDTRSYTFKTSLHERKTDYCTPILFALPVVGNYELGINCHMTSKLLDNPVNRTDFEGSRVILSDRSVLDKHDTLTAAECSGAECRPKFIYQFISSISDGYKIGSSVKEDFLIQLKNIGEVAYDACLRINIFGVRVLKTSSPPCEIEKKAAGEADSVLCKPRPVQNNQIWYSENIYVEMTELTSLNKFVSVEVYLYNHCKDQALSQNFTHKYRLEGDSESISVKGITNIGDMVNMTKTEIKDGKKIEHVYTIVNRGKTNWKNIKCEINLEKKQFVKNVNNSQTVLLFEGSRSSQCDMIGDFQNSTQYMCEIDSLLDKEIKIVIPIDIIPNSLDGLLDDNNVTISSDIKFILQYRSLATSIKTTIQLNTAVVPLWVIIVASLIGLIILILIGFALYECGFLRRENKEQLKQLQKSVKRQTIRRSMMATQSSSEDRTCILKDVPEETFYNEGRPI